MASSFPTSLDTFTNPTSADALDSVSVPHATQHSDLNDAVEALEAKVGADGSAVTTSHDYKIAQLEAAATGKILQVVSTTKTDTFSAATDNDGTPNAQWASVTGLTATITPTAATSKVLVMLHLSDGYRCSYRLTRGGTPISVGDSAGSRQQATGGSGNSLDYTVSSGSAIYLDSPATTSATTYGVDIANLESTGVTITLYINRSKNDLDATSTPRPVSSITLMEVAG